MIHAVLPKGEKKYIVIHDSMAKRSEITKQNQKLAKDTAQRLKCHNSEGEPLGQGLQNSQFCLSIQGYPLRGIIFKHVHPKNQKLKSNPHVLE
jgi:hypothetical protein